MGVRGFLSRAFFVFYRHLQCYRNPFELFWQSVSNIIAIRSQRYGKPQAAVGDRFIVPAYTNTPTEWGTNAHLR